MYKGVISGAVEEEISILFFSCSIYKDSVCGGFFLVQLILINNHKCKVKFGKENMVRAPFNLTNPTTTT